MNEQDTMNKKTHEQHNRFEPMEYFAPMTRKVFWKHSNDDEDTLRWFHTEAYAYARMLNMAGIKIEALKDVYEGGGYYVDPSTTYHIFARACGATYEDAGWMVSWQDEEGKVATGWFRAIMGNGAGEWLADGSLTAYDRWDEWRKGDASRETIVAIIERTAHH